MDVDEPGQATEVQQLEGIRKRFLDALWNYSVVVDKETSQTTSVASNPGSENSQAIFPYRCATAPRPARTRADHSIDSSPIGAPAFSRQPPATAQCAST